MNGCNHENPQDDDMIMEPTPSKRHLEQDTFDIPLIYFLFEMLVCPYPVA